MSQTLKRVVHWGETFRIDNEVRDLPVPPADEGELADPDSHSIQLYKPDGTVQGTAETSPHRTSKGLFDQTFMIPVTGPSGEWSVTWTVTFTGENTPESIKFKVVA